MNDIPEIHPVFLLQCCLGQDVCNPDVSNHPMNICLQDLGNICIIYYRYVCNIFDTYVYAYVSNILEANAYLCSKVLETYVCIYNRRPGADYYGGWSPPREQRAGLAKTSVLDFGVVFWLLNIIKQHSCLNGCLNVGYMHMHICICIWICGYMDAWIHIYIYIYNIYIYI